MASDDQQQQENEQQEQQSKSLFTAADETAKQLQKDASKEDTGENPNNDNKAFFEP